MAVSIWLVLTALFLFLLYGFILKVARPFSIDNGEELSYRLADSVVQTMFSLLRRLGGFRFQYEAKPIDPLPPRFLVVANHQSLLDIPVVMDFFGTCRKVRFVAKRELGRFIPLLSDVLNLQGHALISRKGDMHQSMRALSRFARFCARREVCPVIFPEGTRSKSGKVGAFHSAGVRRILEEGGQLPVVALAIDGGSKVRGISSLFKNLYRGKYRVRIVGVYDAPKSKKEVLGIVDRAREDINNVVEGWHNCGLLRAEEVSQAG